MTPDEFLRVADYFPDAALLLSRDGEILAANRGVGALGYSPQGLQGHKVGDLTVTPSEVVEDYLRLCSRSREPVAGSLELISPDGSKFACRSYGSVVHHDPEQGKSLLLVRFVSKESSPSHFAVLNQKIDELTEQIRRRSLAEERLREQREWLGVTLSSIGDAVIAADAEGLIWFLNPVAEQLTGWTQDEAQRQPLESVFRIINEYSRQTVENPAARVLREGVVVGLANHTILIAKDGTERPIDDSAAPIRDAEGRVEGVVLVFRDVTEQKAAQRVVHEQAQVLTGILGATVDHIYVVDQEGRYQLVSTGAARVLGFEPDEMTGKHWQELGLPKETMQPFDLEREEVLRTRHPIRREVDFADSEGNLRRYEYVVAPLTPVGGRSDVVVIISRDVTERQQAEEALRAREERFRRAADAAPVLIWVANTEKQFTWFNKPWLEFTGRSPEEQPAPSWGEDVHPDDFNRCFDTYTASFDARRSFKFEYRLRRYDGEYRWVLDHGVPLYEGPGGEFTGYVGSCVDVTDRRRAEADARFLADASAALADLHDPDSTLRKVARLAVPQFADWCAVDLWDNESETLRRVAVSHVDPAKIEIAHEYHRRFPPGPSAPTGLWRILRSGEPEHVPQLTDEVLAGMVKEPERLRLLQQLGLRSYIGVPLKIRDSVLGVLTFVTSESGRIYDEADLAFAQDVAHRVAVAIENSRLYREVQEAHRRKDEFLAMLAHELRNPLAPIKSGLDLLRLEQTDPEIIDLMSGQVEHLVRLVDDLLDVSRILRGRVDLQRRSILLGEVVQRAVETVRPLLESQRQELAVSLPDCPVHLDADPVRLTQVLSNLLNNASKYTDQGGRVALAAERQGGVAVLRVSDNGSGIDPQLLPHVFDLFTQSTRTIDRSQGGLGLGLTIVRSLIEMHDGSVTAKSDGPGKGSEFIIRLPAIAAEAGHVAALPDISPVAACRILVVDDNVPAAKLLVRLLGKLGSHEIFTAHSGEAALAAAAAFQPNLILLDIGLPQLDGYEVARRLRAKSEFAETLLVALTGYGTDEDRRRSADAGFDEHVTKPPSIDMLIKALSHPKLKLS